uniref:Uncharacterized protein n=1 Tax=Arthrobacter sp. J3.40 TaxID=347209 RepID=I3W106_9MICC|nr:hypothetical protein [Arthrobacter sp. J3.40]AFK89283.1 hypothetical protein [Arthrobacter sp. J3.40]
MEDEAVLPPQGTESQAEAPAAATGDSEAGNKQHPSEAQDGRRKPGPTPTGRVKKKAAVWADEEVIDRIRGAWFHTPTTSGERELSFSDFLLQAALARALEREQTYNRGKQFPPSPAGSIGVGRKG